MLSRASQVLQLIFRGNLTKSLNKITIRVKPITHATVWWICIDKWVIIQKALRWIPWSMLASNSIFSSNLFQFKKHRFWIQIKNKLKGIQSGSCSIVRVTKNYCSAEKTNICRLMDRFMRYPMYLYWIATLHAISSTLRTTLLFIPTLKILPSYKCVAPPASWTSRTTRIKRIPQYSMAQTYKAVTAIGTFP